MNENPKIYIAGPSVFRLNANAIAETLKAACVMRDLYPLYPLDNEIKGEGMSDAEIAKAIAEANIKMIQEADAIIADVTPFRGTAMDVGTAFEIGMATQRGIPVVAYTEAPIKEYRERVRDEGFNVRNMHGSYYDDDGVIEDFGLYENLMIAATAEFTDQGYGAALDKVKELISQ